MIKISVDSYPKYKNECPFYKLSDGTCVLKEICIGNEFGCRWVCKCCEAFNNENREFDKVKCGMLKEI